MYAETDPYEPSARLESGPFQGELIDSRHKRSIVQLPQEEAKKYQASPRNTVVANFYHEGKFWIAVIPHNAVKEVMLQKDQFPSPIPAAHTQLRFTMKRGKGLKLFPQFGDHKPAESEVNEIVFSAEATMVQGDKYGVLKGMSGRFGVAYRLMSLKDSYLRIVYGPDHHVEQVKVKLKPSERQAVLQRALQLSHEKGMEDVYHTLCNSCTTTAFGVLDDTVKYGVLSKVGALFDRIPVLPRTYLYLRGLIPLQDLIKNPTPSLEEEFAHWKNDEGLAKQWEKSLVEAQADAKAFEKFMSTRSSQSCSVFSRLLGKGSR